MEDVIGQLFDDPDMVSGEWRIPNFLSLPEEVDKAYSSPAFFFLDSCWCLEIYPNGCTDDQSEGWVGIFLHMLNYYSPVKVNISIASRIADKEIKADFPNATFNNDEICGFNKLMKRSDLQSGERAASPSDTLTISYTLKSDEGKPSENTLCHRLWTTSFRWHDTLLTQDRNYVVLSLKDGKIWAHRAILESSSPVFSRMFSTDMRESQKGVVNIEDATESVFQVVLSFAYSCDPKGLSCENVCEVYKVAHKYEFHELRELCAKFMKKTLCVDTVCDVIALADLYQETEIMEIAKDYFAKNKADIFETEKWKIFKRDNSEIAFLVLERVLAGDVQKCLCYQQCTFLCIFGSQVLKIANRSQASGEDN